MAITTAPTLLHPNPHDAADARVLSAWLVAMGEVLHPLDYGGRIAVTGCGEGELAVLLAKAYPLAGIDGFDPSPACATRARVAARRAGVASRCEFDVAEAAHLPVASGTYDLVAAVAGLDPVDPSGAARRARSVVREDGAALVVASASDGDWPGHHRDPDVLGPASTGRHLVDAGFARVRVAWAGSTTVVLDARPS